VKIAPFSYESSGYDHTPSQIRKVYTSPFAKAAAATSATFSTATSSQHQHQMSTSGYSYSDRSGDESAIESGPSFNESLRRFRSAAQSDTDGGGASSPQLQHSSSAFKVSSSSRQQTQNKTVTRSVEEQTMITRN
jgi:hypothetical protein